MKTMKTMKTIYINAKKYEDYDDCLTQAVLEYSASHWILQARWEDDRTRDMILLDVQEFEEI